MPTSATATHLPTLTNAFSKSLPKPLQTNVSMVSPEPSPAVQSPVSPFPREQPPSPSEEEPPSPHLWRTPMTGNCSQTPPPTPTTINDNHSITRSINRPINQ